MGLGYDQVERERKNRFSHIGFEPAPLAQRVRTMSIMPRPLGENVAGKIVWAPFLRGVKNKLLLFSSKPQFLAPFCFPRKKNSGLKKFSELFPDFSRIFPESFRTSQFSQICFKIVPLSLLPAHTICEGAACQWCCWLRLAVLVPLEPKINS